METLLAHFQTNLSAIERNIGTIEDPVMEAVLKEVQPDDGQLASKVTLQLPAAYYDVTRMLYSEAGDNIGIADTDVTVKFVCRKNDPTRWLAMQLINKALAGTGGTNFNGIAKKSHERTEYEDVYVYIMVFGCALFDISAVPERELIDKPDADITFRIS